MLSFMRARLLPVVLSPFRRRRDYAHRGRDTANSYIYNICIKFYQRRCRTQRSCRSSLLSSYNLFLFLRNFYVNFYRCLFIHGKGKIDYPLYENTTLLPCQIFREKFADIYIYLEKEEFVVFKISSFHSLDRKCVRKQHKCRP